MYPRHDFYTVIHKAIRRELSLVVIDAGTAQSPTQLRALATRLRGLGAVLEAHAEHEAQFLHGRLVTINAALVDRLDGEHGALDTAFREALDAIEEAATTSGRVQRLAAYTAVSRFASSYFSHMQVEEREAMPAFCSRYGDDELAAVHVALVGSISPDTMGSFLALMLPAIDHDERVELLGGVRVSAPPPVFASVLGMAEQLLPPPSFSALQAVFGVAS